jgi:transposase InsO family protein
MLFLAKADWIVAQERDRACAAVRAFLDGQPLPREEGLAQLVAAFAERCSIVDGLLVVTERNHGGRRYEKVWVPEVLRYSALCQAHDDPATGGHVGVVKTLDRMDKDFFWPTMTTDVRAHVRACTACARKAVEKPAEVTAMARTIPTQPWAMVGFDFVGPLPETVKGNKYAIVAVDTFTKYAEVKAVARQDAVTTAKFLFNRIMCRHGCPATLVSDQGSAFTAELTKEVAELWCARSQVTPAHHHQGNGSCERFIKTFEGLLKGYLAKRSTKTWDEWMPLLAFAYNTAVHSSTGESPFFLNYLRDPQLPIRAVTSRCRMR